MNYFTLLGRLLLIAYSLFMLLFAIGEGITNEGFIHIIPPIIIVSVISIFWKKPVLSAVAVFIMFLISIWFFGSLERLGIFLIVSLPLAIASILFLIGSRVRETA